MSSDVERLEEPLAQDDCAALTSVFRRGEKTGQLVGGEYERAPFNVTTLEPEPYLERVQALLSAMAMSGLEPHEEKGYILALSDPCGRVTLEPGGQVEYSTIPLDSLHSVERAFARNNALLTTVGGTLGMQFSTLGFRPDRAVSTLPWMPRERHRLMGKYLITRGRLAHHMMLGSCTVQANFDFESEADMAQKMRCAYRISPIVAAIFANSPYVEGLWSGFRSYRYFLWNEVDPDRCGRPDFVYEDDFSYARIVEWALDIPMLFIRRSGQYVPTPPFTFRDYLKSGYGEHAATLGDFENHLSLLFPEVRLKQYLEVRSADGVAAPLALALPALWKGILYDADARRGAEALVESLTRWEREALVLSVAQNALHAFTPKVDVGSAAAELLRLAREGLRRQAVKDDQGRDESIYLAPLEEIIATRTSPADATLERFGPDIRSEKLRRAVLESSILS